MVQILLGLLGVLLVYYLFYFVRDVIAERGNWGGGNFLVSGVIGFITDAMDTLGIGSIYFYYSCQSSTANLIFISSRSNHRFVCWFKNRQQAA